MSTAGGLGARLLKACRGEEIIEISGIKLVVRQMSAKSQILLLSEVRDILPKGAEVDAENVDFDLSKVKMDVLLEIVHQCSFDEEGNRAFESPDQAGELPTKFLMKIVQTALEMSKEENPDDTKGGSTEAATS